MSLHTGSGRPLPAESRALPSASVAVLALARVVAAAADGGLRATREALVREARTLSDCAGALLYEIDSAARTATLLAADPPHQTTAGRRATGGTRSAR